MKVTEVIGRNLQPGDLIGPLEGPWVKVMFVARPSKGRTHVTWLELDTQRTLSRVVNAVKKFQVLRPRP